MTTPTLEELAAERREREAQWKADDKRSTRRCIAGAVPATVVFFAAFVALRYLTAGLDGRDGALTDIVFMVVYAVVTARVLYWWGERPSRRGK